MRIVHIQKIIIIFSLIMGLYSNALKSMAYDYAQLALLNVVNAGVHMVADANSSNPLFSGLAVVKYPFSVYSFLGAGKTLYDMCLLHNKHAILTKTDNDNKTLTEKKGVNLNVCYSGLIQCIILYGFFVSDLYRYNLVSERSVTYFALKSAFFIFPGILSILFKQYDIQNKLDNQT